MIAFVRNAKSVKPKASAPGAAAGAGKDRAAVCAACHGDGGASTNPAFPSLAGQNKDYIVAALTAYRAGTRRNELMTGIAKGLSDADVKTLASYYSRTSAD